jgi:cytoskeletal protein RodZ
MEPIRKSSTNDIVQPYINLDTNRKKRLAESQHKRIIWVTVAVVLLITTIVLSIYFIIKGDSTSDPTNTTSSSTSDPVSTTADPVSTTADTNTSSTPSLVPIDTTALPLDSPSKDSIIMRGLDRGSKPLKSLAAVNRSHELNTFPIEYYDPPFTTEDIITDDKEIPNLDVDGLYW